MKGIHCVSFLFEPASRRLSGHACLRIAQLADGLGYFQMEINQLLRNELVVFLQIQTQTVNISPKLRTSEQKLYLQHLEQIPNLDLRDIS